MKRDIGCLMVLGLAVGVACIAYAVAPTATILGGWSGLGVLLWWKVSRTRSTSPPPLPSPPLSNAKPQFSVVPDTDNPHRSHVVWHNEGTKTDG